MRRAVLIAALVAVSAVATACKTTQPAGTQNQMPIDAVGPEPVQTVPAEPAGPAGPITAPPKPEPKPNG